MHTLALPNPIELIRATFRDLLRQMRHETVNGNFGAALHLLLIMQMLFGVGWYILVIFESEVRSLSYGLAEFPISMFAGAVPLTLFGIFYGANIACGEENVTTSKREGWGGAKIMLGMFFLLFFNLFLMGLANFQMTGDVLCAFHAKDFDWQSYGCQPEMESRMTYMALLLMVFAGTRVWRDRGERKLIQPS